MEYSVKSLAEVEVDNIHCSPLIYPASHAIVESYQIGQAWFPLGESMLTTHHNLLFLHYFNDDIQNELLPHFSRDGGEADHPVVSWVLLLALFEDWSDTGFPPVLRHLSCPPGPFKGDGEWFCSDLCQLTWQSTDVLTLSGCSVCYAFLNNISSCISVAA